MDKLKDEVFYYEGDPNYRLSDYIIGLIPDYIMARMVFIENDGAIFREFNRANPLQVWNPKTGWKAYTGVTPKGVEWGTVITAAELLEWQRVIEGPYRYKGTGG